MAGGAPGKPQLKRIQSQPVLDMDTSSKKKRQEEPPKKTIKIPTVTAEATTPKPAAAVKTRASKPEVKEQVCPQQNEIPAKSTKAPNPAESAKAAAVNSCLNRKSTSELDQQNKIAAVQPKQKQIEQPQTNASHEGSSSDAEQSDEELNKVLQQKAAHARYMRFSRSLKSIWAVFQSNLFFFT